MCREHIFKCAGKKMIIVSPSDRFRVRKISRTVKFSIAIALVLIVVEGFFIANPTVVFWAINAIFDDAEISIGKEEMTTSIIESSSVIEHNSGGDYSVASGNSIIKQENSADEAATQKITAKAALAVSVKGGKTQIFFEKNKNEKLPVASLTKLMTALVVLENYDLDRQIIISKNATTIEGKQGELQEGQSLSVKNLLYITLIESSNKAAYALTEVVGVESFVALMNLKSKELGLSGTFFADNTGLNPQSYSTAEDIGNLLRYLFENYPLFLEIARLKEYDLYLPDDSFYRKLINTNKLLGELGIIGGKTGWTEEAKGCFAAIQQNGDDGDYSVFVVLGADDRFREMRKLINGNVE